MNLLEINELRKKQLLSINLILISFFIIVGTIIFMLEPSRLTVFLFLIVFMGASSLLTWREMNGKEWRWSSWSRKLVNYEKEKLGGEWFKSKRMELTTKLFIIAMFFFQLLLGNARELFMPVEISVQYWISLLLAIVLLANINLFFRNRKIDRLTTEELQGFTKKEYGIGIVFGIILAIIIIWFAIMFFIGTL